MPKKYIVKLKSEERTQLSELVQHGYAAAKTLTHAHILLKANATKGQPHWTDEAIHEAFGVSCATIERVRKLYVQHGLDAAIHRQPHSRYRPRRLDGSLEAHLIALACSEPPTGHEHWTLRLLADKLVQLNYIDAVSYETVRRTLKKMNSSRGSRSSG